MEYNMVLLIIGMAVVTYIPRMLPLVFLSNMKLPSFVQGVLANVPYAMLGALIIPGIFLVQDDIWFGIIGGLTACIVAYFGGSLVVTILSAVFVLMLYTMYV